MAIMAPSRFHQLYQRLNQPTTNLVPSLRVSGKTRSFTGIYPPFVYDRQPLLSNSGYWQIFQPQFDQRLTLGLRAISKGQVVCLSDTLSALVLPPEQYWLHSLPVNTLFFRSFYPQLLCKLRRYSKASLLGNPGIGKASFQCYYLACMLNPQMRTQLIAENLEKDGLPTVLVLQRGALNPYVCFLKEEIAHECTGSTPALLEQCLWCEERSEFIYESDGSDCEHFKAYPTNVPLFAVATPDSAYINADGVGGYPIPHHLPTWTLNDLQNAAAYIRSNAAFSPIQFQKEFYSESAVAERFDEFGGIFGHVLPPTQAYLNEARKKQMEAVASMDPELIVSNAYSIDNRMNSSLIQTICHEEERSDHKQFLHKTTDLLSTGIEKKLRSKLENDTFRWHKIWALIRNDKDGFMEKACLQMYAEHVSQSLVAPYGVRWRIRQGQCTKLAEDSTLCEIIAKKYKHRWRKFHVCLLRRVKVEELPAFSAMKRGVLYVVQASEKYPDTSMVFKAPKKRRNLRTVRRTAQKRLVWIQVTRNRAALNTVNPALLRNIVNDTGLDHIHQLRYILCPPPASANGAEVSLKPIEGKSAPDKHSASRNLAEFHYQVLKVPKRYYARDARLDEVSDRW